MKQYQLFIYTDYRTVMYDNKTLGECVSLLRSQPKTKFNIKPRLTASVKLELK